MFKQILLFTFLLIFGCTGLTIAQNYSGNQKDIDQILQNIEAFSQAYMNKDYDAIAEAYAINGKILPPRTDIIEGRKAIKERWMLPEGVDVTMHKIMPTEIKIIGNDAYDTGYYEGQSKRENGAIVDFKGKYVIIWHKIEGDWKIYLDIWNGVDN